MEEDESDIQHKKKHPREQFSVEEDEMLKELVAKYGVDNWKQIASKMPNRNTRQCKDRWNCYLSPSINKQDFSLEEDMKLISLYHHFGSKWKQIAGYFPGRTHICIRNRMKIILRKKMRTSTSSIFYYLVGKQDQIVSWNNGNISILQNLNKKKANKVHIKIEEAHKDEEILNEEQPIDLGKILEDSVTDFNFEDFSLQ